MPNGETLLHGGDPSLPVHADIIFVHGLRGDSIRTWSKGSLCWPRDLLPQKVVSTRIYTWGYDSSVAKTSGPSSQASIFGHGENLLSDLARLRQEDEEETRPIVFVGHSLGGLVIKQALIRSAQYFHSGQDVERGSIYRATEGIVFLGTPHRGSSQAGLAQIVSDIIKIGLRQPNDKLIDALKQESQVLEQQSAAFSSISRDISLVCMAEELGTGIGVIVPKSSATLDGFNVKTGDIPANHMNMCKFNGENDIGFKRVAQFITSFVRQAMLKRGEGTLNILRSLEFPQMNYRETTVADAWAKTFEWFLPTSAGDSGEAHPVELRQFIDWIESDKQELFWISGKAGSGKSTLMKKLFSHPSMRRQVEKWAQPDPVAFAAFYFFDRGDHPLQKSREGLFRAILYQLISAHPVLASSLHALVPSSHSTSQQDNGATDWSWERLCAAFNIIKEQPKQRQKIKLCLFLDGLDEYSALGNPVSVLPIISSGKRDVDGYHENRRQNLKDIRKLVLSLAASPIIKLCVSSRRLNPFESAFSTMPLIRLEDLTAPDIRRFVIEKFHQSPKWQKISSQAGKRSLGFVNEIVNKASGVFLWVTLVVERVLEELEDGSRLPELRRYVNSLPAELHMLYGRMLKDVKDDHRDQGIHLFRLCLAMKRPPTAVVLHFAETATTETVLSRSRSDEPIITSQEAEMITDQMRDRLRSRCAGLLEVSDTPYAFPLDIERGVHYPTRDEFYVQFLHQTVKEFLLGDSEWPRLYLRDHQDSSDVSLSLLRASIMGLKVFPQITVPYDLREGQIAPHTIRTTYHAWKMIYDAIHFAKLLDHDKQHEESVVALLDDLDSTASKVLHQVRHYQDEHWVSTKNLYSSETDLSAHDDFLSFAIQAGLTSYILCKLQISIHGKRGKPYLEYAVAPVVDRGPVQINDEPQSWQAIGSGPSEPEIVRIILEHGADPNDSSRIHRGPDPSNTVWGNAVSISLKMMLMTYSHQVDQVKLLRDRCSYIENIKLLIEAGADPDTKVQTDDYVWKRLRISEEESKKPLDILRVALRDYPKERGEIVKLLLEKGGTNIESPEAQFTTSFDTSIRQTDLSGVDQSRQHSGNESRRPQQTFDEERVGADPKCGLFMLCLPSRSRRQRTARGNRSVNING